MQPAASWEGFLGMQKQTVRVALGCIVGGWALTLGLAAQGGRVAELRANCDSGPQAREGHAFGWAMDFGSGGGELWVGAPRWALDGERSGAVFGFERVAGGWEQVAQLLDPAGEEWDQLGWSVVRSAGWILAAAPQAGGRSPNSGAVRAWRLGAGAPQGPRSLFSPEGQTGDGFGTAMLAAGGEVWVAAPFARADNGVFQAGRVERFAPGAGPFDDWVRVERLVPPLPLAHARFGEALALQGTQLLVGAPFEPGGGGVYRPGAVPLRIANPLGDAGAEFGGALACGGQWVAVGAPGAGGGRGAVLLFDGSSDFTQPLGVWLGHAPGDRLGSCLAWSGDCLLAGAPGARGGQGAVRCFDVGGGWPLEGEPLASPGGLAFGASLASIASGVGIGVGAPAPLGSVQSAPGSRDLSPVALPRVWLFGL
ncbi:MAG: hypothetical protein ACI8QC_002837 [Planctomycetota bacterium]|jgi:hypothetical protein